MMGLRRVLAQPIPTVPLTRHAWEQRLRDPMRAALAVGLVDRSSSEVEMADEVLLRRELGEQRLLPRVVPTFSAVDVPVALAEAARAGGEPLALRVVRFTSSQEDVSRSTP